MNAQVQKTLDTLESALQSLTDSIYTYNPSSAAARALVQAEEDLTRVLAHVAEHQSLHHRLLALSSLASEIDAQTVNILQKLESCHAELTALPPPPTPIAEPPTERVNPLLVEGGEGERKVPEYARPPVKVGVKELLDYAKKISKFSTPGVGGRKEEGAEAEGPAGPEGEKKKNWLTKEEMEGINAAERAGRNRFPWPEEDKMKSGALWAVQTGGRVRMVE